METKKINLFSVALVIIVLVIVLVGAIRYFSANNYFKQEIYGNKIELVDAKSYEVDSFSINEDKTVSMKLKGIDSLIKVDFHNVSPNGDYYCNIGVGANNTLNGTKIIQKSEGKTIRISPDLEREIKKEIK